MTTSALTQQLEEKDKEVHQLQRRIHELVAGEEPTAQEKWEADLFFEHAGD